MPKLNTATVIGTNQRIGLDSSTLVRAAGAQEWKRLAQRGNDCHDRRRNPIAITERGMELASAVAAITGEDVTPPAS